METIICEKCRKEKTIYNEDTFMSFKPEGLERSMNLCNQCREDVRGLFPDVVLEIHRVTKWLQDKAQEENINQENKEKF